ARLDYEVGRARRYGGSVSVIALQSPVGQTINGEWQRLAATVSGSMRALDTCWVDSRWITLVLPETDMAARSRVIDRILEHAQVEAVAIEVSASTFPHEAPTSDALLRSLAGSEDD
ncbi:MAG: hypothetical protein ACRDZM_01025, partial [Acidimicrobiia bacterium]